MRHPCPNEVTMQRSIDLFFIFESLEFFWVRSQSDHVVIGAVPEGSDYVPCSSMWGPYPTSMVRSVP